VSDPQYASIPAPTRDVDNLVACINALKQNVEMLTGQRGGEAVAAARVFVAEAQPVGVVSGDLWIVPSQNKMFYWWEKRWNFFSETYSNQMARQYQPDVR
jgi:hypothetical protein